MSSIFGDTPIVEMATRQIQLEMQKVGATIRTSAQLEVFMTERLYRELVWKLESYVLAEKLVGDTYKTMVEKVVSFDHTERFPASWWQHFKLQHLPTISKWRPVRYHEVEYLLDRRVRVPVEVTFERYATYPHANEAIPRDRLGAPVIFERVVEA